MEEKTLVVNQDPSDLIDFDDLSNEVALLPQDKRSLILTRLAESKVRLSEETRKRVFQSDLAKYDVSNFVQSVNVMSDQKRVFSGKIEGVTGSGSYKMDVKGGDSKLIIPILCAIGVILLALAIVVKVLG